MDMNSYPISLTAITSGFTVYFLKNLLKKKKYLKKSCSFKLSEQCFFKFISNYVVEYSRKDPGLTLAVNELILVNIMSKKI
jgi:hypothetical protein